MYYITKISTRLVTTSIHATLLRPCIVLDMRQKATSCDAMLDCLLTTT